MNILAELEIPEMFKIYGCVTNNHGSSPQPHLQKYTATYLCSWCKTMFTVDWRDTMQGQYNGGFFRCPACGECYQVGQVGNPHGDKDIPFNIRMSVKEYKDFIDFEIRSWHYIFENTHNMFPGHRVEKFRFYYKENRAELLINSSSTLCTDDVTNGTIVLGDPMSIETAYQNTVLRWLKKHSLPRRSKEMRHSMAMLLKTLRKVLQKKLGTKKPMHVSSDVRHGPMFFPLFNMAFRTVFPDAPNLSRELVGRGGGEFNDSTAAAYTALVHPDIFEPAIQMRKAGKNSIQVLIESVGLPDKPQIRKILQKDIMLLAPLTTVFRSIENYDMALAHFETYSGQTHRNFYYMEDRCGFIKAFKAYGYGEEQLLEHTKTEAPGHLRDHTQLLEQLNGDNKKLLRQARPRLRDLHDWMAIKHREQTHENVPLPAPEHVKRRLCMQVDRLKFFLPEKSMDLFIAGHQLHNCVASYEKEVLNGNKNIILMTDDNGKLIACLEIRKNTLVQAKLNHNRPCHRDETINKAVLDWAKKSKLKINTPDVAVPKTENKVAV